jgi:hypothetical protein
MQKSAARLFQRCIAVLIFLAVPLVANATSETRVPQLMVKLAPNASQGLTAEQALARLNGPSSVPENAALQMEAGYPVVARFLITSRLADEVRANLAAEDPAELLHHWLVLEYPSLSESSTALNNIPGGGSNFLEVLQDHAGRLSATPNDPFYSFSGPVVGPGGEPGTSAATAHGLMRVGDAWNHVTGHAYVSPVDVGIRRDHPDLLPNYRKHFSKNTADNVASVEETCPAHISGFKICGHGTHVAGIVAAKGDNGTGTSGVCWSCSLSVLRITPVTANPDQSPPVLCAPFINSLNEAVTNGVQVLNFSFGVPEACAAHGPVLTALQLVRDRQISWAAASGNIPLPDNVSVVQFPARHDDAIAVGATTASGARAGFSTGGSSNRKLDFMAPGDKILSTFNYENAAWQPDSWAGMPGTSCMNELPFQQPAGITKYGYCSGTSMASPMIAGALALLRSANPLLTLDQSKELLRVFAQQAGNRDVNTGYGLHSSAQSNHFYTAVPQMAATAICGKLKHGDDAIVPTGTYVSELAAGNNAVSGYTAYPQTCSTQTPLAAVKLFTTNKRLGKSLIPLYRHSMNEIGTPSSGAVGHNYTTDVTAAGYVLDGVEGYIYPPDTTPQPLGTVALWRRYSTVNKDYMIFPSTQGVSSGYGIPPTGPAVLGFVCPNDSTNVGVCGDVVKARNDFNGNGHADILWRNSVTGDAFMQLMGMSGANLVIASSSVFYGEPNMNWEIVGTGDFDGDRKADILWRNKVTGDVFMQRMNGTTIVSSQIVYSEPNTNWEIAAIADYNGDGKADMLWYNKATGQVYVLSMDGFSIGSGQVVYTEGNLSWKIVGAGDYNGDGMADILWRNTASGDVFMQLMNGFTVSSSNVIYSEPSTNWKIISSGDFNGDSKSDILWYNTATGAVFIQVMQGLTIAESGGVYTEANTHWSIVATADYNGDGRTDLLWRNDQNGQVYLMPMKGLTVQAGQTIYTETEQNWKVVK